MNQPKGWLGALMEIPSPESPKIIISEHDERGKTLREVGVKLAKKKLKFSSRISELILREFIDNYKNPGYLLSLQSPLSYRVGDGIIYKEHLEYVIECLDLILNGEKSSFKAFNLIRKGPIQKGPLEAENFYLAYFLYLSKKNDTRRNKIIVIAENTAAEIFKKTGEKYEARTIYQKYLDAKKELQKQGYTFDSYLKQVSTKVD